MTRRAPSSGSRGLWLGLLLWPALALARAPAADAPDEVAADASGQLAQLRAAGTACYRRREYRCALEKFEAAFALAPSPELRFNVASAEDKLGLHTLAVRHYRAYLKQAAAVAPGAVLGHIQQRLAQLLPRVGRIRISVTPRDARVLLNGAAVDEAWSRPTPEAHELVVDAGHHRIELTAPGHLPAARTVAVLAGQLRTLSVTLAVDASSATPQSAPVGPARPAGPVAPDEPHAAAALPGDPARVTPQAAPSRPLAADAAPVADVMARPVATYDLPVQSAALGSHLGLDFGLGSADITAYHLCLDGSVYLWDRLQLGLVVPLLLHGIFPRGEASSEETHFGNLELRVAGRLYGGGRRAFALALYVNARLPTTSADLISRKALNLRPGLAVSLRRGHLTLAGDAGVQYALRDGVESAWTVLANVWAAYRLHRYVALELALQTGVLLNPVIDQPAIGLLPALTAYPVERVRVAIGPRVAVTEAGKIFTNGVRAALVLSGGYDF